MKKILFLLALVLWTVPAFAVDSNVLTNGSFDTDYSGWTEWGMNWRTPYLGEDAAAVGEITVEAGVVTVNQSGYGSIGLLQVVPVVKDTDYTINGTWSNSTGLYDDSWAETIVYSATEAEVQDMVNNLWVFNGPWPQESIVAKKDNYGGNYPGLNNGALPWNQAISSSATGDFAHAHINLTGPNNQVTATEDYLLIVFKVGSGESLDNIVSFGNLSLTGEAVTGGDADFDGDVDADDLATWGANYTGAAGSDKIWGTGDFDGDGDVDADDLATWGANYTGVGGGGSMTAVPEPATMSLLATGGILGLVRRKRK